MALTYGLGVDVGTTFTAAATYRSGRSSMVILGQQSVSAPSIVYAAENHVLLTGEEAAVRAAADPSRAAREFKRRMGDPTPYMLGGMSYPTPALMAALVQHAVRSATEAEGGPPAQVAVTHPATWGPYRRRQFAEVCRLSGWESAIVISEPEAAAAHHALVDTTKDSSVVVVYDLGGGTFDTTLLRTGNGSCEVLGTPDGVDRAGGLDFDDVVLTWVEQATGGATKQFDPHDPAGAAALARLRRDCTAAKEELSVATSARISVLLPGRHTEVELSRAEFERRIRPILEETLRALHRTLRSGGVQPEDLAGVILAGGSSRIPLVAEMLAADLGRPVLSDRHPKHAVALGAAALAALAAPPSVVPTRGVDPAPAAAGGRASGLPPAAGPAVTSTPRRASHSAPSELWTPRRVGAAAAVLAILALVVALVLAWQLRPIDSAAPSAATPTPASADPTPSPTANRTPSPTASRTRGSVAPTPAEQTPTAPPTSPAGAGAGSVGRTVTAKPRPTGPVMILSKDQSVSASSTEQPAFPASAAVDADPSTRWSSTFTVPQWLKVDLGAVRQVTEVKIDWEISYATAYSVRVSADGSAWRTVYTTSDGRGGVVVADVGLDARYVRLDITRKVGGYGCSLWDFDVYGSVLLGG